jgi:hypothetical protein
MDVTTIRSSLEPEDPMAEGDTLKPRMMGVVGG